jgi:dTDP-4-amino-4,6-dideoxygalactose transaminase
MVVTSSEATWRLLKSLSNQGRAEDADWLDHERLGYNYRLDDVAAALGLAQLEKLDLLLELRAQVAARYGDLLESVDGVEPPLADDPEHLRSWFVYPVRLAPDIDRARVREALAARAIQTKVYLPSIHLQPYMRERFGFREGMLPVSEEASRRLLALPFFGQLEPEDQERVVDALHAVIG